MRLKRQKRRNPFIPIAPFGDIAFLLIIFFVAASVFMKESHITVHHARSRDIETVESGALSVVLDTNGELWLQGERCPKNALEPAVAALVQDMKEKKIVVKIDKDQVQHDFEFILRALSEASADIVLLGEKDTKRHD